VKKISWYSIFRLTSSKIDEECGEKYIEIKQNSKLTIEKVVKLSKISLCRIEYFLRFY